MSGGERGREREEREERESHKGKTSCYVLEHADITFCWYLTDQNTQTKNLKTFILPITTAVYMHITLTLIFKRTKIIISTSS